jgi:hypothetical protein
MAGQKQVSYIEIFTIHTNIQIHNFVDESAYSRFYLGDL